MSEHRDTDGSRSDDGDSESGGWATTTRRRALQAAGVGGALALAGCTSGNGGDGDDGDDGGDGGDGGGGGSGSGGVGDGTLRLATTTSTFDTGLLGELNPMFQDTFGVQVEPLVQGTGAAIRTARDGDADIILVHARGAEDQFLRDGFGVNRRDVMFNDFVVVGPEDDPAGINGMGSATEAFVTIADTESTFLSRGDDSGTNKRELAVWDASDAAPSGAWYQETGKGMGDTLNQATQVGGYTLADRGTYLSQQDEIDLVIHVQGPLNDGPDILRNPYGVIPVNPAVHEDVNYQAAMAYVGFLTGPMGQEAIGNYTANGSQLFFPNALADDPQFDQYVPQDYAGNTQELRRRRYQYWVENIVPNDY
jgi:tungstate transport system substrate-binding protein